MRTRQRTRDVIQTFSRLGFSRAWLEAGSPLCTAGARADGYYIIVSGRVLVTADPPPAADADDEAAAAAGGALDGGHAPGGGGGAPGADAARGGGAPRELGRGSAIGLAAVLTDGRHDATSVALRDSELIVVPRDALRAAVAQASLLSTTTTTNTTATTTTTNTTNNHETYY